MKHLLVALLGAVLLAFGVGTESVNAAWDCATACCCGASCSCAHEHLPACACGEGLPEAPALPPSEAPTPLGAVGAVREERAACLPGSLAQRCAARRTCGEVEPRFGTDVRQGRRRHGVLSNWRE